MIPWYWYAIIVALLVAYRIAPRLRGVNAGHPGSRPPALDAGGLRQQVLTRDLFKSLRDEGRREIQCAVMDWGVGEGSATLVAFVDDTTSLYTSTGGGIIGAGVHAQVRDAARAFREQLVQASRGFVPAPDIALPARDQVRFFAVTPESTLASPTIAVAALQDRSHPLFLVGQAAQATIAAIRTVQPPAR